MLNKRSAARQKSKVKEQFIGGNVSSLFDETSATVLSIPQG
ncbi:hypothetical protein [Brasilonema octagenarum]|nr:hypothetical protein [Brasilonema octagenarum]